MLYLTRHSCYYFVGRARCSLSSTYARCTLTSHSSPKSSFLFTPLKVIMTAKVVRTMSRPVFVELRYFGKHLATELPVIVSKLAI